MIGAYYRLAKPGIVYGNVFTTIAALLFASRFHPSLPVFAAAVLGMALVIASACVFNNYLDRHIDAKMPRTKDRALVTGVISARSALAFASALGVIGLLLLFAFVNALTAALALFGFLMYVFAYGAAKRASSWGTIVGSIPGAIPIVAGYAAVTGRLDLTALILFLILAFWQMPHFYAIAIYRLDEYAAAGIPVLPVKKGIARTKRSIVFYIGLYLLATVALAHVASLGYAYLASVLLFGLVWLGYGLQGFHTNDDARWARKAFLLSLIALVSFSVTIAVAPLLP